MPSSTARNNSAYYPSNVNENTNLLVSFSSSSASSSSSSSSPKKSMEEVWNHISLASLNDDRPTTAASAARPPSSSAFRSAMLQDFLSTRDGPLRTTVECSSRHPIYGEADLHYSLTPPPATALSLNSGSDFHLVEGQNPRFNHLPGLGMMSFPPSPALFIPSPFKKGVPENDDRNNANEKRNKRMMKNRESAARSRARKQAYTNELELAVAHLQQENGRLRQQAKLFAAPDQAHLTKKHALYRTLTAPF